MTVCRLLIQAGRILETVCVVQSLERSKTWACCEVLRHRHGWLTTAMMMTGNIRTWC